jgi:hypothetical protein
LKDTHKYVERSIEPVAVQPNFKTYLGEAAGIEDVSDLAD